MYTKVLNNPDEVCSEALWLQIAHIERDMRARQEGLGEYIVCRDCGKTSSKQEIYGYLSQEVLFKNVDEIEKLLGAPYCVCGSVNSHPVYPIDVLLNHYMYRLQKKVHTILLYTDSGELLGYMTGYQDSYDNLYTHELSWHYGKENKEKIKRILESRLNDILPKNIYNGCSVGTLHNAMSFRNLYILLQQYFLSMSDDENDMFGIFELDLRGNLYAIFYALGLQKLGVSSLLTQENMHYKSDIFFQRGFVKNAKDALSLSMRDFLKKYGSIMKEIKK